MQRRNTGHSARSLALLDGWRRDLAFAVRALGRARGFTFTAVLSLGCAIALMASTLAVVNGYLVRAMPYPGGDRLYHVIYAAPGEPEPHALARVEWDTLADVVELADRSSITRFYLKDGGFTEEAAGLLVAGESIDGLGVRAVIGRSLEPADYGPGAEHVAVIGHALWRDRFASDPGAVGRVFRASIGDQTDAPETFRIAGVMAPGFRYVREYARATIDVVVPLRAPTPAYMVRLREGVSQAAAESRIAAAVARATGAPAGFPIRLERVQARYASAVKPVLTAITIAAALVVAIGTCGNAVDAHERPSGTARQRRVGWRWGASGPGRSLRCCSSSCSASPRSTPSRWRRPPFC